MTATAQFEGSAIALLSGLLADPAALRKRLSEYGAARAAALVAEDRLNAARSSFEADKATVTADLGRLEKQIAARRERVEGLEGVNESHRSTIAQHAAEWQGIGMPDEVGHE